MLKPKLACSGVCLKSWLSTILGVALRCSSITTRMPLRFDSSSMSSDSDDAFL